MPELPEVEVVKRSLINKTQNLIVKAVKINDGRLRYKIDNSFEFTLYLRLPSLILMFLIILF